MFKDDTVFVIGAGASHEFGFPVGSGLSDIIRDGTDFSFDRNGNLITGNLFVHFHYSSIYDRGSADAVAAWNIRLAKSQQIARGIDSAESIDEYIFKYSDDSIIAEVGKLHIAHAISSAESNSILHPLKGFGKSLRNAYPTWIWGFYRALINGVAAKDVANIGRNIKLISFNYDRTVEHFLETALTHSFEGLSTAEAREIVQGMDILHPYGSLGHLEDFAFGDTESFPYMARNIITWSETIEETDTVDQMKSAIANADRIVFLGFGFADQNMKLLSTRPAKNGRRPSVYSTGIGRNRQTEFSLSQKIVSLYESLASPFYKDPSKFVQFEYEKGCAEFINIHRLNLVR